MLSDRLQPRSSWERRAGVCPVRGCDVTAFPLLTTRKRKERIMPHEKIIWDSSEEKLGQITKI